MSVSTEVLQQILDEQGYIVYGSYYAVPQGFIFDDVEVCQSTGKTIDAKAVVIGTATEFEFKAQIARFYRAECDDAIRSCPYYYKVIAE